MRDKNFETFIKLYTFIIPFIFFTTSASASKVADIDKSQNNVRTIFREGEEVWAREFNKDILWSPSKIVRRKGRVLYDIKLGDGRKATRHVNQLRKRSCSNVSVRVPVHVPVRTSLEPETQPVAQPSLEARTSTRSRAAPSRLTYDHLDRFWPNLGSRKLGSWPARNFVCSMIGAQLGYPQNFKSNAFSQAEIWTLKICISWNLRQHSDINRLASL